MFCEVCHMIFRFMQNCIILDYTLICNLHHVSIVWAWALERVFITMKHRVQPIIVSRLFEASLCGAELHSGRSRLIEIRYALLSRMSRNLYSLVFTLRATALIRTALQSCSSEQSTTARCQFKFLPEVCEISFKRFLWRYGNKII